jgi:TPR repeat protein
LACKLCARWWARLWAKSEAWERARSNDSDLWAEEPARNRELIEQAYETHKTDPAAAFRLYLEAAEAGSAWAMEAVAWHYETGSAVPADFDKAQDYYRRAIGAGSWMATIHYARLLADHGHHDICESVLKDGVSSDFVPACFWLARLRYERCRRRKPNPEIRPMLEHAAKAGHPAAQVMLARLMILGKFGLRAIPAGFKLGLRGAFRSATEAADNAGGQGAPPGVDGRT